jgi:hypothetical protein
MLEQLIELMNFRFEAGFSGPMLWIGLGALGLAVGIITGLFGVGGGFLVSPMLANIFGVSYDLAVGSDLCFIIGTSTTGLCRHHRLGNVDIKTILCLGAGSILGALLGDRFQIYLKTAVAGGDETLFTLIMNGLFLPILLLTAWLVWRGPGQKHEGAKTPMQKFPLGPHVDLTAAGLPGVSLPGLMAIGLSVGVLTGLLGVGGGVLFMPILLLVVGLKPHHAVGTSLGVVLMSALIATAVKAWDNKVSLGIAAALLVTSVVGVQIGAWLCMRLHGERLRKYFSLIVLAAVVMVAVKMAMTLLGGEVQSH